MKSIEANYWTAVRRDRKYFPTMLKGNREAVGKQLEAILEARYHGEFAFRVEEMTDQIEVIICGRRVAIYMA